MDWIVIVAVWILCGVIAYGRTFAHFQRKYPTLAAEYVDEDQIFALAMAAIGPFGLLISLIMGRHGMMFRRPTTGEK